jgi:transposase
MNRKEYEFQAKQIVHFYKEIAAENKRVTIKQFVNQGIGERTIRKVIQRYETRGKIDYKEIPGRPPTVATPKNKEKISNAYKKNPNLSVRQAAVDLKIPSSSLCRIKVHKLGIKAYSKQTAPLYTKDQEKRDKTNCRKIYRKTLLSGSRKILLIDDETYVPIKPSQIPGKEYYHCTNKNQVLPEFRLKRKEKFTNKYMVWQAIDECGHVSDPYISDKTMTGEVYVKECLEKILLPFIKKYHKVDEIIFWPDMATCHYKRCVIDWFNSQNIKFIEKTENAPNVPQARPIEKFWALCKKEYKKRKFPAKNLNSFKRIWKNIYNKVANKSAQKLMASARRKLREIGYNGVNSSN